MLMGSVWLANSTAQLPTASPEGATGMTVQGKKERRVGLATELLAWT